MSEIDQEQITQDGYVNSFESPDHPKRIIRAVDGLKLGGKHLEKAYKGGVLTIISPPMANKGVLAGVSAAFKSASNSGRPLLLHMLSIKDHQWSNTYMFNTTNHLKVIDDENEVIAKAEVALHAQIGTPYKDGMLAIKRQLSSSSTRSPVTSILIPFSHTPYKQNRSQRYPVK